MGTSSANQVMQYLSQMTTLAHVPIVSKTSAGTSVADTVEAVSPGADYVSWSFTFDPRYGDAKKLTFKFTDAVGDEQKTSAVIGSAGGSNYLTNELGESTNGNAEGTSSRKDRYANNKIVMTYTSGSTFYDSVDADYDGDTTTAIDAQTVDDKFHDELAMDVVPGTTMKVSSAEKHHVFLYQMESEANQAANIDPVSGCVDNTAPDTDEKTSKNLHIVVEYQGQFSKPHSLCRSGAADTWAAATGMDASIVSDIAALAGLTIAIEAQSSTGTGEAGVSQNDKLGDKFNGYFSWGATHSGSAKAVISFTLPMGADGDNFKVHLQLGEKRDDAVSRYSGDAKNHDFRVFTHRERNNNGRTFTVTKAYENKVSDLLSVSRIASMDATGSLAGVIATVDGTNAWDNAAGCGIDVLNKMNPGTYYNVRARVNVASGTKAASAASAGAMLMVVVNGNGEIAEVQVTSGGLGEYAKTKRIEFADTRLHAAMDIGKGTCAAGGSGSNAACAQHVNDEESCLTEAPDATSSDSCAFTQSARCDVVLGDMTNSKKSSMVLKSLATGMDTGMACLDVSSSKGYTCDVVSGFTNSNCDGSAVADYATCIGKDLGTCSDKTGGGTCNVVSAGAGADLRSTCEADAECEFALVHPCEFKGTCGTRKAADTVYAGAFHHAPNTPTEPADGFVTGARHTVECNDKYELSKITKGGNTDIDNADTKRTVNIDATSKIMVGGGVTGYDVTTECTNEFYYQFGFYSTGTPRWNRDLTQNNHDMGKTPKDEQVALYGMKNHMQYQFKKGSANMQIDNFYGLAREVFTDINSGIGSFDVGYSITDSTNDGAPQMTTSVIAGENGAEAGVAAGVSGSETGYTTFGEMMEHAEKYAYIGRGYDKLTVTPIPDAMTDQKVTITYTGPSAGCTVTEVDRGTHESSECSGRGNCDYATGTCLCDAGYK